MKIYTILLMCGLLALNASCQEDNDCCDGIPGNDEVFEFSILDEAGNDLLDPATEGTLNTDNISILELKNGNYTVINNPRMDASGGYRIYADTSPKKMRIFPGEGFIDGDFIVKKIILRWNDMEKDSVNMFLRKNANIQRLVRITYNEDEVWNSTQSEDGIRYFQVVK